MADESVGLTHGLCLLSFGLLQPPLPDLQPAVDILILRRAPLQTLQLLDLKETVRHRFSYRVFFLLVPPKFGY